MKKVSRNAQRKIFCAEIELKSGGTILRKAYGEDF